MSWTLRDVTTDSACKSTVDIIGLVGDKTSISHGRQVMKVFDIILRKDAGERAVYDIAAISPEMALQEAWRRQRQQPFWDGVMPPPYAQARIGDAQDSDTEPPKLNEHGFVEHSGHCMPYEVFKQLVG
jgi:hypothetical protein